MTVAAARAFWTDQRDFVDLADEIWLFARSRGAGYLSEERQDALRDWLYASLTEQIEAADAALTVEADAFVHSLMREPSREVIRTKVREFLGVG